MHPGWIKRVPVIRTDSSNATAPESSLPAHRGGYFAGSFELGGGEPTEHQLRDSIAPANLDDVGPEVLDQYYQLSPVVWINRAGTVGNGQAEARGQPRSWTHLTFKSGRKFHNQAGPHGANNARPQA